MANGDHGAGIPVSINKLIVDLENELVRIERGRAIRMHGQMCDRLVRKEIGRAIQIVQPLKSHRPIELAKQKNEAGVGGIFFFARLRDQSFITGEFVIGEVKGGTRFGL